MRGFLLTCASLLVACGQTVVASAPDSGTLAGEAGPRDASEARDGGEAADASVDLDAISGADADPDSGAADARPAPDATPLPTDGGVGLACHVDRFSSCADPDEAVRTNNTTGDSFYQTGFTVGCATGDNFVPGNLRIDSRICHTEPADWFEVTYVPCSTLTMRVRVNLTLTTPCDADAIALQVSNRPCDGSNPDVRCTQQGNQYTVEYLIPPGNSVGSIDFGVVRVSEDVAADYQLTYEVYR